MEGCRTTPKRRDIKGKETCHTDSQKQHLDAQNNTGVT